MGFCFFGLCGGGRLLCESAAPPPLREVWQMRRALKTASPYFQGASAPHRIHWTAGKLPFRLQSEHGVRSGAEAECSLPAGHAQRSRRLRCADPHSFRRQESKLHSEVAGASRAGGQAEVCGPVCLKTAKIQNTPADCGVDCFGPSAACCIRRSEQAMRRVPPGWCIRCFRQSVRTVRHPRRFT